MRATMARTGLSLGMVLAAALAVSPFLGSKAEAGSTYCGWEDGHHTRLSGYGSGSNSASACEEASYDIRNQCDGYRGGCCRTNGCDASCFPLQSHGLCRARIDAWPYVERIDIVDDGGSGNGGKSDSSTNDPGGGGT